MCNRARIDKQKRECRMDSLHIIAVCNRARMDTIVKGMQKWSAEYLKQTWNIQCRKATQQRLCTENLKQIFPDMKLRGLVLNSYIHVSVRDFGNWEQGRTVSFLGTHKSDLGSSVRQSRYHSRALVE
jgi:hypothetical protein